MSRSIYSTMYPQIPLSILLVILSISSSFLSQQVVNSQPLNHQQQDEQGILLKLMNDWGYPMSFNDSWETWDPSAFPYHCDWNGVVCDDVDGYVYGIQLINMSITHKIPPIICDLKNLKEISLSYNFIPEFPTVLYNCSKLETLDLSHNDFQGRIPDDIDQLSSLRSLNLRYNHFFGDIPASIGRFSFLQILQLGGNQFNGSFPPEIGNLTNLEILSLASNNFLPSRIPPEFGKLKKLKQLRMEQMNLIGKIPEMVESTALPELELLALDGNQLSGEIPSKIISWRSLIILSLSRNQISGELPLEIWLLPRLNYLDLSENQISGELPSEIASLKLAFLDLSSNQLTGEIPTAFQNVYESSFWNNSGQLYARKSSKLSPKLFVIVVIAGVTFLVSILLILFVIKGLYERKPKQKLAITWDMTAFQELHFAESNILSNLTENNQIGSGGAGKVYRVPIDHLGNFVAVKKIWRERNLDQRLEKQFQAEIQILGSIRHNNIVKLLCCISNKVSKLLVYEYMENGSLYQWLHENNCGLSTSNDERFLDWSKRLKIAVEVAQGLSYMHDNCFPPIIHRDVKSSNILLDSDFKARIADFGLARTLTKQGEPNSASVIAGSFGYIAPEYAHTSKVSEKIDVYSFGVVLLELVTGKEANKGDEYRNLAEWAWSQFQEVNSMDALMDEGVKEECYLEEMRMMFKLGMICTDTFPSNRPSMKEALQILFRHGPLRPTQGLSSSSPRIQREE